MGDYTKMWESLNIDLEKHDILCEALPVQFTDTYLTQKTDLRL